MIKTKRLLIQYCFTEDFENGLPSYMYTLSRSFFLQNKTKNKALDLLKLKAFADEKLHVVKIMVHFFFLKLENAATKRESVGNHSINVFKSFIFKDHEILGILCERLQTNVNSIYELKRQISTIIIFCQNMFGTS